MSLRKQKGFTLVELLIVMAIIAVLVGITIAGLGFAMRRSRNIARMSAMTNLDRAVSSYYSDEREYPANGSAVDDMVASDGALYQYLEGSWETPSGSTYYYLSDAADNAIYYMFCVNQEQTGTTDELYECVGSGIGQTGFPSETSDVDCEGDTNCGTAATF
jgi:prepilin-type N-terminal cleavage/methylation domain-containing protein